MIDRRGLGEKVIRSVIIKHVAEDTLGSLSDIDNTSLTTEKEAEQMVTLNSWLDDHKALSLRYPLHPL